MKEKVIKIPIFFGRLRMIQVKKLKALNKRYKLEGCYAAVVFRAIDKKGREEIVVAFEKNSLNNEIIAHECIHIVNLIFLDIGMKLDLDNDEAQAYLTGYLFSKCEKFLKSNKKKKK